jgi:acetyl-CoA synthetase
MSSAIEPLFEERRRFPPSPEFASQANATDELYKQAERDYTAFWAGWAR